MDSSLKKQVLAEWRGYRETERKPPRWISVGDALPRLMGKLGLGERLQEKQVQEAWLGIVGEFLAAQSQPVSLQSGELVVQVMQPAVHYELDRNCKQRIIREMNRRFGKRIVRSLRFRLG